MSEPIAKPEATENKTTLPDETNEKKSSGPTFSTLELPDLSEWIKTLPPGGTFSFVPRKKE